MDDVVAQHLARGDHHSAATLILEHHGDELYRFLVHHLHDQGAADEVFSQFVEDLWVGLPSFRQRCAIRTWLYLLARHAAARFRRSPWQARSTASHLEHLADQVRSRSAPWLRSDVKDRFRALRQALEPDDRSLLLLRIDQKLPWDDVARVFLEHEAPTAEEVARESARLRKRLQFLKEELRERARAEGLLDDFAN